MRFSFLSLQAFAVDFCKDDYTGEDRWTGRIIANKQISRFEGEMAEKFGFS